MSATAELVYESNLGTLERIEENGAFTALVIGVKTPATTSGWLELVDCARTRGYVGRLAPLDSYADGSEGWLIHPAA
jgi:hypothetical protein